MEQRRVVVQQLAESRKRSFRSNAGQALRCSSRYCTLSLSLSLSLRERYITHAASHILASSFFEAAFVHSLYNTRFGPRWLTASLLREVYTTRRRLADVSVKQDRKRPTRTAPVHRVASQLVGPAACLRLVCLVR